jgi:hypothetical protein
MTKNIITSKKKVNVMLYFGSVILGFNGHNNASSNRCKLDVKLWRTLPDQFFANVFLHIYFWHLYFLS